MTGVTVNPLTSAVSNIRKAATFSFQTSFELLNESERAIVLTDLDMLSAGTSSRIQNQKKTVVDTESTTEEF